MLLLHWRRAVRFGWVERPVHLPCILPLHIQTSERRGIQGFGLEDVRCRSLILPIASENETRLNPFTFASGGTSPTSQAP